MLDSQLHVWYTTHSTKTGVDQKDFMNKYAVISLSGKQHVVTENENLQVDHIDRKVGEKFEIKDVLLSVNESDVKLGKPLVEGAKVKLEVISHERGEKVRVATFKAKSRQRKARGHRQALSTVKIVSIS